MANEFLYFSYILGILGSASFGYLVLRYGIPDFRTLPDQSKFGISSILGIGIFGLSYFASQFFFPLSIWQFLSGLTLFSVMILGVKNNTLIPQDVKVAVPILRLADLPEPTLIATGGLEESKVLDRRVFSAKKVVEEEHEISAEETAKEERELRKRGSRRRELREEVEEAKGAVTAEPPRPQFDKPRGRERYLERRKDIVKQVKTDLVKSLKPLEFESPELEEKAEEAMELGEGLDLSDLENVGSLEDLSELGDIDLEDLGGADLDSLAGISETQKIPKSEAQGAKCPNCGKLKGTIVYCPYCGKGFCSDCSTAVKREGELIHYKCPTCAKEVMVKDIVDEKKNEKKREKKEEKKIEIPKEKAPVLFADRPGGMESYQRGKYKPGS